MWCDCDFQTTINRLLRPSGTMNHISGCHVLRMRKLWLSLSPLFLFRLTKASTFRQWAWQDWSISMDVMKLISSPATWSVIGVSMWQWALCDDGFSTAELSTTGKHASRPVTLTAECLINDLSLVTVLVRREPLQSVGFTSAEMFLRNQSDFQNFCDILFFAAQRKCCFVTFC